MDWNKHLYEFDAAIISSAEKSDKPSLFDCQLQPTLVCRICALLGHPTDKCPMLQAESYDRINSTSVFPGLPHENDDPYSNTYNSEWMDHDNLAYGNTQMHWHEYNVPVYQQFNQPYPINQQQCQSSNSDMSLEDMFKSFMTNALQYQQETNALLQNMTSRAQQLSDTINRLEVQYVDELPSHTVIDQTDDESEIVLGNGNEIQEDADNISIDDDIINVDNDVLCDDDMPKMDEIFEQIDKKLEDTITLSLGLNAEEIEQHQELKEAKAELNSLPMIFNKNAISSIGSPVTHNNSFILQVPNPHLKSLPSSLQYLLLGLGEQPSYEPQMRFNLPMKDNVMDGILKIHEIGVT